MSQRGFASKDRDDDDARLGAALGSFAHPSSPASVPKQHSELEFGLDRL